MLRCVNEKRDDDEKDCMCAGKNLKQVRGRTLCALLCVAQVILTAVSSELLLLILQTFVMCISHSSAT